MWVELDEGNVWVNLNTAMRIVLQPDKAIIIFGEDRYVIREMKVRQAIVQFLFNSRVRLQ